MAVYKQKYQREIDKLEKTILSSMTQLAKIKAEAQANSKNVAEIAPLNVADYNMIQLLKLTQQIWKEHRIAIR